jgi:F0F1-type ATP synthase assembly protein I
MRPASQGPGGADLAGIGMYFAGAVLIPIVIGAVLDSRLHTGPWLVLVGLFVGLAAGATAMWLKLREYTR